ncbi:MAG: hypothetical protein QOF06_174 [Solirubrobacterales bacterium]|jgi:hypothetical protein|nr:hypothetical protein [Solirubrobacterales bacterium]
MEAKGAVRRLSDQEMQAASIQVSISTHVASATLGALAGAIALFTYLSQTYDLTAGFYGFLALAGAAFVLSLVIGASGSSKVARLLITGTWTATSKIPMFSAQAFLALVGLVLLLIATAVALGSPQHESSLETRVQHLEVAHAGQDQHQGTERATQTDPTRGAQNQPTTPRPR